MIINTSDFELNNVKDLLKCIFIYPTDTIYGIGCDAENQILVEKIRNIKNRDKKPFSIIAPSFDWILKNCEVKEDFLRKYLPGPYTLILKKKDINFLKFVSDTEYLGVRIPNSSFTKELQSFRKPIITTSVNFSGESPANAILEINPAILKSVDFVFDSGELTGKASTIIFEDKVINR